MTTVFIHLFNSISTKRIFPELGWALIWTDDVRFPVRYSPTNAIGEQPMVEVKATSIIWGDVQDTYLLFLRVV